MKKSVLLLAFILIISIPTTALAAVPDELSPFVLKILPSLTFDDETANCTVTIIGDNMSDTISATLKLWQGSTCLATWSSSGNGYMQFSRTRTVTAGVQYKMTVDVTINGVAKPTYSIWGKCN